MRGALYFAAAAAVALTAFWAYRVNYAAQAALDRVSALREEIGREREALTVLRAEWAYLNAPDRLRRLVEAQAEALALEPMAAARFGDPSDIAPPRPSRFWVRLEPEAWAALAAAPGLDNGEAAR